MEISWNEENDKLLQNAIISIEEKLKKILKQKINQKHQSRISVEVRTLLREVECYICRLQRQVRVLHCESRCFIEELHPQILKLVSETVRDKSETWKEKLCLIFKHFFSHLLRIQDGMILCTSGECRHDGDIREAKLWWAAHRKSELLKLPKLYSPSLVYSGSSLDDVTNADVGILARLSSKIKSSINPAVASIWDLGDKVTTKLELVLNSIESVQRDVKELITNYCKNKLHFDLEGCLHDVATVNLTLKLTDFDEVFIVRINRKGHIRDSIGEDDTSSSFSHSLTRSGFIKKDENDYALPLDWTTTEQWWKGSMQISTCNACVGSNNIGHCRISCFNFDDKNRETKTRLIKNAKNTIISTRNNSSNDLTTFNSNDNNSKKWRRYFLDSSDEESEPARNRQKIM